MCRQYSFQKLAQFSQRNNVLDALASHIDRFLWRDMCFFKSVEWDIWKKERKSAPYKPKLPEVFCLKSKSTLTGKNVLNAPDCDTNGFISRDTCVSSTQVKRPIWNKESLSPP
jgi:hypothetical protein